MDDGGVNNAVGLVQSTSRIESSAPFVSTDALVSSALTKYLEVCLNDLGIHKFVAESVHSFYRFFLR